MSEPVPLHHFQTEPPSLKERHDQENEKGFRWSRIFWKLIAAGFTAGLAGEVATIMITHH